MHTLEFLTRFYGFYILFVKQTVGLGNNGTEAVLSGRSDWLDNVSTSASPM